MSGASHMRREIDEIPALVAALLDGAAATIAPIGRELAALGPPVVATAARGSSDHAAHLFKIATEITAGCPVASLAPSIASVYAAPLDLRGAALLAVSQSGRSPDLLALVGRVKAGGAFTVAIVNDDASPLAALAHRTIPIGAGVERSVAATKTFVASAVAALALLAAWRGDAALARALADLPTALAAAIRLDWPAARAGFADPRSALVVGRGPMLPMAQEAALKLKETARVHAEAASAAEVLHGPVAMVREGFPVLALAPADEARPSLLGAVARLRAIGAAVLLADHAAGASLPLVRAGHRLTDPLAAIVTVLGFVEALARARGLDPDRPPHLAKVTETV